MDRGIINCIEILVVNIKTGEVRTNELFLNHIYCRNIRDTCEDIIRKIKIVIIKRKTRLEDLIMRFNTVSQARFYIEHLGADFDDYYFIFR